MQWWWRLGLGPSCHQALLRWEFSLFLPTTIFFPISIVSRQLCCCCCCYCCWKEPWCAFGFSFSFQTGAENIWLDDKKQTSKTRLLFLLHEFLSTITRTSGGGDIFITRFLSFYFFAGNFFFSFLLEFICCRLHLLPRKTSAFLRRFHCVFNKLQFWRLQTLSFSITDWVCHVIASTMFFSITLCHLCWPPCVKV